MMSMSFSYVDILNMKSSDYRCIITGLSKNEAINLMKNIYKLNIAKHKNLLSHIKVKKY